MIELTPTQRRALRARAHTLHPVVSISEKGLTESVRKEIDRCLAAHELIKIRIYETERDQREALLRQIGDDLACSPVQHIGNILVVWRQKPDDAVQPAPRRKPGAPRLTKKQAAEAPRRRPGR